MRRSSEAVRLSQESPYNPSLSEARFPPTPARAISVIMADNSSPRTFMCLICGFIYDEAAGLPEEGIPPGTRWEDVPMNWVCPECGARKEDFEMVQV